jgi:hypothetical protein
MKFFLVIYDRDAGRLRQLRAFDEPQDALRERFLAERAEPDAEIVVLSARSEDALRRTHARYFAGSVGELLPKAQPVGL